MDRKAPCSQFYRAPGLLHLELLLVHFILNCLRQTSVHTLLSRSFNQSLSDGSRIFRIKRNDMPFVHPPYHKQNRVAILPLCVTTDASARPHRLSFFDPGTVSKGPMSKLTMLLHQSLEKERTQLSAATRIGDILDQSSCEDMPGCVD